MPYRRLPNTDASRIRALRNAYEQLSSSDRFILREIDIATLKSTLDNFERFYAHYNEALRSQVSASQRLQLLSKESRLYISHFIQVLHLAVVRKEISKEARPLYGLDTESNLVPDLTSNELLIEWGDRIIAGENQRKMQGGTPLYNPSIARMNVSFSKFKEACFSQKQYQDNTAMHLARLRRERIQVDRYIQIIWNEIETLFSDLDEASRLEACRQWGIVYYLRKREKEKETIEL